MLFSEPKIPQWQLEGSGIGVGVVSVLFSEPKIPQSDLCCCSQQHYRGFSALQRAENSSIAFCRCNTILEVVTVSVLFSEPKIPQYSAHFRGAISLLGVSVLFSEPKIPQS